MIKWAHTPKPTGSGEVPDYVARAFTLDDAITAKSGASILQDGQLDISGDEDDNESDDEGGSFEPETSSEIQEVSRSAKFIAHLTQPTDLTSTVQEAPS